MLVKLSRGMHRSRLRQKLPGSIATGFLIGTTSLWTLWGVAEMYYEGWWGAWYNRLPYLIPGAICLALTLVVLAWPRTGGWLIILIGAAFTAWWWRQAASRGVLTMRGALSMFPVSGMLVITGLLFLMEARHRQRVQAEGYAPAQGWLRRQIRPLLAIAIPLLVAVAISVEELPLVLSRVDDGDRSARLIEGNSVRLVWAPAGPGWSKGGPGKNLSWEEIALYGVPPVGFGDKPGYKGVYASAKDMQATSLCAFLSEDGLTLMPEPQNVWRMPTTDEIVRSLVRRGRNAGCNWDGKSRRANCSTTPDKETPLWSPNWSPIYYWSADEYDEREAYYVSYNGSIGHQPKTWGNPRHGYRCVREP